MPMTRTAYPQFAFLVPTAALAEAGDPYRYPHGDTAQVLDAIVNRLRPLVDTLTRDAPTSGQTDNSWYAVSPLLLNGASPDSVTWMRQYSDSGHRSADTDDGEHTVWSDLVAIVSDQLAQRLANPGLWDALRKIWRRGWRCSRWLHRPTRRYAFCPELQPCQPPVLN